MQGLTWTNATTIPVAKPGAGTLGTRTVIGLSRGFALYNDSLPTKTRLVMPAETGPIFSDDHVRHTRARAHRERERQRERERDRQRACCIYLAR